MEGEGTTAKRITIVLNLGEIMQILGEAYDVDSEFVTLVGSDGLPVREDIIAHIQVP